LEGVTSAVFSEPAGELEEARREKVILEGVTSAVFSEPTGYYSHLPAALHIQEQHRVSQTWLSLI